MNKVRFLAKIAMAASVFAALTFTFSCSDDKGNNSGGGTGKWCVYPSIDWGDGSHTMCGEIGAKLHSGNTLTEESCNSNYTNSSIEDEKPGDCEEFTTG